MSNDINSGKVKQIKGKAREETGKLTGNKTQEIKGKVENAVGKVQEEFGKAKRNVKNSLKD